MKSEPRLPLAAADLAAELASLDPAVQRRVARAMCDLAAERRTLADPRYDAAHGALSEGRYGDGPERGDLLSLVEELDRAGWETQEQAEAGHATLEDYAGAFATARAVNALWCALDEDPRWSCLEATYEAYAAVDEDDEVLRDRVAAIVERG